MNCKIFYSWQSDLPNKTNRGFIETALEAAAKSIRNDDSIKVEPVIDRDTKDVPGSPDIAHTIFGKIEQAQVFVCDISIINQNASSRLTPNPNVLLELGYAIKALGWNNVIMVLNSAFAKPEELPFDLRMRRVITYFMPEESEDRSTERKKLQSTLETAIRNILEGLELENTGEIIQPISTKEEARIAVENFQQNQTILLRRFMTWLRDELDTLKPDFTKGGIPDELLIQSIEQTKELVIEFAKLAEIIAIVNNSDAAREIYKQFELILERYNRPRLSSGISQNQNIDFDFYKFIGHELFVSFFSFLIRESRWELIAELLEEGIYVDNPSRAREPGSMPFTYVSQYIKLLDTRNNRLKLNRILVHADILNERHQEGKLAEIVSMQQFMEADCFLFMRAELHNPQASRLNTWIPWSNLYLDKTPRYLLEASSAKYAARLLRPLGVSSIEELRDKIREVEAELKQVFKSSIFYSPFENFNPQTIGTQ